MFVNVGRIVGAVTACFFASGVPVGFAADEETFFEVSLQCPELRGGTLQLTKMNGRGVRDRVTIVYDDDTAIRLELAIAEADSDFDTFFTSSSPEAETDAAAKEMSDSALARFGVLRRGICLAPQRERDRYLRVLERQKRVLERR